MKPIKIKDSFDLYKLLKINNISLNHKDKDLNTILHLYVLAGDFRSSQIIVEEFKKYKLSILDENILKQTPLDIAKLHNFLDIVVLLEIDNLSKYDIRDCYLSFFKNQEKYGNEGNNIILKRIQNNVIFKKVATNHFRTSKSFLFSNELEKSNIHYTKNEGKNNKTIIPVSLKELYWVLVVLSDMSNLNKKYFWNYSWKYLDTKKRYLFSENHITFNTTDSLDIAKKCLAEKISLNTFFASILNKVIKKNLLNNNPDTVWLFSTNQSNNFRFKVPENYHQYSFMPITLNKNNNKTEIQKQVEYHFNKKTFNFIEWYMKIFNFMIYFKPFKIDFFKKHLNQERSFFGMIHDMGIYNIESQDKFIINNSPTSYYKTTCTFITINSEINLKLDIHESVCSAELQKEIFKNFLSEIKQEIRK